MTANFKIVFASRALKDLAGIDKSISTGSHIAASEMVLRILSAIDGLKMFPNRTKVPVDPGRRPPVRSLPERPYVIYFRVYDNLKTVSIVRVRHGARRPLKRFD